MTPVASWTPADYHRAFNRARAAWEATQPQLTIDGWADGLDEPQGSDAGQQGCPRLTHAALRFVEPASSPAGSQMAGEPHRTPPSGRSTRGQDASSPAYTTTTAPAAEPEWDLRGRGQKGA